MGKGSRVVFSSTVESFGIKYPQSTHSRDGDNELSLSDLPFEVIRTIAAYLDSFRYIRSISIASINGSVPNLT